MLAAFINQLKQELLKQDLPGEVAHKLMAPVGRNVDFDYESLQYTAKQSAVLVLVYPGKSDLEVVLMQRNFYDGPHSGQVSFPGGKREPEDESLEVTARREFGEEVGVQEAEIQILGELSVLYIPPSNFLVTPYIGYMNSTPKFQPDESEVTRLLTPTLKCLFSEGTKSVEPVDVFGQQQRINVPCYKYDGEIIWGATAMMLSELEVLYKRIYKD